MPRIKFRPPKLIKLSPEYRNYMFGDWRDHIREHKISTDCFCAINIPSVLNRNSLGKFLFEIEWIFAHKKINYPLFLVFENCISMTSSGMLLIYMFLKITAVNKTSELMLSNLAANKSINAVLEKRGFLALYDAYMRNMRTSDDTVLHEIDSEGFFIFPQRLHPGSDEEQQKLVNIFVTKIVKFYSMIDNSSVVSALGTCIGEIISNFWAHADTKFGTYIVAEGHSESFKLFIIDTGTGIISSLATRYTKKADSVLLKSCIERGISSRRSVCGKSFHMGCGLYYVSEIVRANNGRLDIWSEGYRLSVGNKMTKVEDCGFWKGTILELSFQTLQAKGISQALSRGGLE